MSSSRSTRARAIPAIPAVPTAGGSSGVLSSFLTSKGGKITFGVIGATVLVQHLCKVNQIRYSPAFALTQLAKGFTWGFSELGVLWAKVGSFATYLKLDSLAETIAHLAQPLGELIGSPGQAWTSYWEYVWTTNQWSIVLGSALLSTLLGLVASRYRLGDRLRALLPTETPEQLFWRVATVRNLKITTSVVAGVILTQHLCELKGLTVSPASLLAQVAEGSKWCFSRMGIQWAKLGSFMTPLSETMVDLAKPLIELVASPLEFVSSYWQYVSDHQSTSIVLGSILVTALLGFLAYRYSLISRVRSLLGR